MDKRSASTFLCRLGGCATLIHPTTPCANGQGNGKNQFTAEYAEENLVLFLCILRVLYGELVAARCRARHS